MADERPNFTERTWPENAWPTAEQFRDWFLEQSPEAQLYLAERTLVDAQRADRCILMDHEAQIDRFPHVLTAARAQALREAADSDYFSRHAGARLWLRDRADAIGGEG